MSEDLTAREIEPRALPIRQRTHASAYYIGWPNGGVRALVVETADVTFVRLEEESRYYFGQWEESPRNRDQSFRTGYRGVQAEALRLVQERMDERADIGHER